MRLTDLGGQIVDLATRQGARNTIIGLSVVDGSGKSTLAEQLAAELRARGHFCRVISTDDYLQPKSIRHANPDEVVGYLRDNFDFNRLKQDVIAPTRDQEPIHKTIMVRDLESDALVAKAFDFDPPGILIVEGVLLFRPPMADWFDLKIWIDMSFETAATRVLHRSRDTRYGTHVAIAARYKTRFFPAQRRHLSEDDPVGRADVVIAAN